MAGFYFRLENEDGTPADPPVLHTAVPNWSAGTSAREACKPRASPILPLLPSMLLLRVDR
jgi:hypothetical protein